MSGYRGESSRTVRSSGRLFGSFKDCPPRQASFDADVDRMMQGAKQP